MDIYLSIVNTNNRELLLRCLETLPAACSGLNWSATVVDNASTDGSVESVAGKFPNMTLVQRDSRHGFSANHNLVISQVTAKELARYIVILNEDTELEPGSLVELVDFCDKNQEVGAAGPLIVGSDGAVQSSFEPFPTMLKEVRSTIGRTHHSPARKEGWLNGSCVLIRTEAFRQIGLLDEAYFIFYEDVDLGYRLHRAGWKSVLVSSSRILHHGHMTVSRPEMGSVMERQVLRSRYLFFLKHKGPRRALWTADLIRLALAARALKALASGVRDRPEREHAKMLWSLARYQPWTPLAHERS